MGQITKEEMIEILKDSISFLSIDKSDIHHDIRDYCSLDDEDYDYIAEDILDSIEYLLSKKRSIKIQKIKSKIK